MTDKPEKIAWHPGFYGAAEIELRANRDDLVFEREYNLSKSPCAFTRKTIFEMSNKVLEKIAVKYGKVMEGVKTVMGGRVLEHEAKSILNEGRAEGRVEGRSEGMMEKAREMAINLYANDVGVPTIAAAAGVPIEMVRKWLEIQHA